MRFASAAIISLLLVGCVATRPASSTRDFDTLILKSRQTLPPELREQLAAYFLAEAVSEACRKDFRLDGPAESELAGSLYFHLRQNGFVNPLPSTKGALLTDEEYQDSLQRYIRSRGIVEDKQETWCRAGYTEFEEDTLVGHFLKNAP